MAKPIKKLDLKRETVRTLKVRASIRTGGLLGVGAFNTAAAPTLDNGCVILVKVDISQPVTISLAAGTRTGDPQSFGGSLPAPPVGH